MEKLIGKLVAVSDNTPQPPARFSRKLEQWERNNYQGDIVEVNEYPEGLFITIHTHDIRGNGGGLIASFNKTVGPLQIIGNGFWDGKRVYTITEKEGAA